MEEEERSATPNIKSTYRIMHGLPTPPDSAFGASRVGSMTHLPEAQEHASTPVTSPTIAPPTLAASQQEEIEEFLSLDVEEIRIDERGSWEGSVYPVMEREYRRLK